MRDVLGYLRDRDEEPYEWLMSVHGCDYLPEEPRLGVHYQLLSHGPPRAPVREDAGHGRGSRRCRAWWTCSPPRTSTSARCSTSSGCAFEGHPDLRRILMPEDYVGHPQRRDFPMGGEPVLFTFNEHEYPRWYE